jgi:hypothetical protein
MIDSGLLPGGFTEVATGLRALRVTVDYLRRAARFIFSLRQRKRETGNAD